jgi:cobalt transporter subunit CbtB
MQNQASVTVTPHVATVSTTASTGLQLTTAVLLGVVILFGVGFTSPSVLHNAAHDVRHAQGFPCH